MPTARSPCSPGIASRWAIPSTPVGRNVTEQRRVEEALRQSQKMEAVGQLTGGIAHDFNNLLQGITGSLNLLERRLAQGRLSDLNRFINGAMGAANRAAALTHRLLAYSRRQPLDPKPVSANPLIASMEDLLRRTMGEQIELDLILAPRSLAHPVRSAPVGERGPQSGHQRAGRDARRRQADHPRPATAISTRPPPSGRGTCEPGALRLHHRDRYRASA